MQLLTDDRFTGRQPRRRPGRVRGRSRRLAVLLGRTVLWTLFVVLLARSSLELAANLGGAEQPVDTPPVAEPLVSTAAAEGFAVRFVHDYLTYDAGEPQDRATRLAAYVQAGGDDQLGWDGIGEQTVVAAVPFGVEELGQGAVLVTVAALVDDGRWLQLLVPVHSDGAGRLAVSAAPSFVPFALPAAAAPAAPTIDAELSRSVLPVLESFFRAYGDGRPEELAYYVPVGQRIQGLQGLVSFEELIDVRVGDGDGDRAAEALVQWRDRSTGAALVQQYRLGLTEEAGRWYVTSLGAAGTTDRGGSRDR